MDTRKLSIQNQTDDGGAFDIEGDGFGLIAHVDCEPDPSFGPELTKRFNRYPLLVAFIQAAGKCNSAAELQDFIASNYEVVMENNEGDPIDEEIEFDPDLLKE